MLNTIKEAIKLLISNFILFSQIVLTVWLPGSILIVFLHYHVFANINEGDEIRSFVMELRISNLIEFAFSPLYGGALIYALSKIKQGLAVSYGESMSHSSRRSFRLFATRLSTGLIIFLGWIALIVPGIILGLRFALIDEIVVLERSNGANARKLSAKLTKGKKTKILGTIIVAIIGLTIFNLVISWFLHLPLTLIGQNTNFLLDVVAQCLANIFSSIIYIIFFLFYWQSKHLITNCD